MTTVDGITGEPEPNGAERPECFVIMPISTPITSLADYGGDAEHFRHVLDHLFEPAVTQAGFAMHPPSSRGSDLIHAEIVRRLETSALVLCDMSMLNPNVFFELGIRTAVDKPICLVRDDKTERIPFDTGILNTETYDSSLAPWKLPGEIDKLAAHLAESYKRSDSRNTLWRYFGLTSRASFEGPDSSSSDDKLDFLLSEMASIKRRIGGSRDISVEATPVPGVELRVVPQTNGDITAAITNRTISGVFDVTVTAKDNRNVAPPPFEAHYDELPPSQTRYVLLQQNGTNDDIQAWWAGAMFRDAHERWWSVDTGGRQRRLAGPPMRTSAGLVVYEEA